MNKVTRSRYLPPSEADDEEATAETPEETLEELEARADTIDEVFKQQSAAAEERIEDIRKRLCFTFAPESPVMELVIETQEAILSLIQTQALTRLVRKELAEKRDEELRELKNL